MVYLIGHPGVGKYTVGAEIAELTGARLLDNHLVNNPIFAVLPRGAKADVVATRLAWQRIGEIRELMLRSMEDLAAPDTSFVLTNVINGDDPEDVAVFDRVETVARSRRARFVPVVLRCDIEEQLQRATTTQRAQRLKWTDREAIREAVGRVRLYEPVHVNTLRLDTTALSARAAAEAVVAHCGSLTG
jgi:shikimate kinase